MSQTASPPTDNATNPLAGQAGPVGGHALEPILQLLRAHGGQGFEGYKPGTVRRRIERRMGLHGLTDAQAYAALLQASPAEVDRLFRELLIGVTSFFRDPALWQALARQVLPALMAASADGSPARAWCAGCSTGEEAYSLAMAWLDLAQASPTARPLQLFATDLNPGAIARARQGRYSLDRLHGLSDAQVTRYFNLSGQQARVRRPLRQAVLFAEHDMTADPPFGRLDLLLCRHVLVYLQTPQQQALMRLFHQALKPGAHLVLGLSETIGPATQLFKPLDGLPHIYQRLDGPPTTTPLRPWDPARNPPPARETLPMTEPHDSRSNSLQRQAERLLLDQFAPAALLVSASGDLLWTSGPTDRYLDPPDGRSAANVLALARPSLRSWLASALRDSPGSGPSGLELRGLHLAEAGPGVTVDLSVLPFEAAGGPPGLRLIVLQAPRRSASADSARANPEQAATPAADPGPDARLLQDTVRRLRQQLQSAAEDYQSAHEELQASNEELTTSREEMQSMNEELQAINAELQAKLDALALAQSDIKNLLDSTQIATLFLDQNLHVRRFTEQARQLINLRDGDAGRPLSDLTTRLDDPGLVPRAAQVLRTQQPSEEEVSGPDGRWFAVRILPYRTAAGEIAGVVITVTDTTRSDASQRARLAPPEA